MSLAYNASPWISDTPEQQTQKRIPTMRKTIKKMQMPKPEYMAKPSPENPGLYSSDISISSSPYQEEIHNMEDIPVEIPTNMQSTMQDHEKRQNRVNEILKNMNQQIQIENEGGNLANFRPLEYSAKNTKKSEIIPPTPQIDNDSHWNQMFKGLKPQDSNHPYFESTNLGKNNDFDQTAVYHRAYDVPSNVSSWSRGNGTNQVGMNTANDQQRLLDKINYMIHLLEQQQNEKTNNSLEEFVMFSLVGVFIIYVLDSFSRTARYTR